MNTNGITAKGRVRAVLRAVADSICSPVWVIHMPGSTGTLGTGQAGAAGQPTGPYIAQEEPVAPARPDRVQEADWDYALMPLRQY